jgi:hypothetical protein
MIQSILNMIQTNIVYYMKVSVKKINNYAIILYFNIKMYNKKLKNNSILNLPELQNVNLIIFTDHDNGNCLEINNIFKIEPHYLPDLQRRITLGKKINFMNFFEKFDVDNMLDTNFLIDIEYKFNNKNYKINIKKEKSVNFEFPVYDPVSIKSIKSLNQILYACVKDTTNENCELDITKHLEYYAGPKKNFYNDTEYFITLQDIITKDGDFLCKNYTKNNFIEIQDIFLNEYEYNFPFNKKMELNNTIDTKLLESSKKFDDSVLTKKFFDTSIFNTLRDMFYNLTKFKE